MTNNFTVLNDTRVNQKILSDLEIIKNGVISILDKFVISIYLVGGFGRAEGGVIIQNNKISIVNDYDLMVVVNNFRYVKKEYEEKLSKLADNLAKQLDIKQIDLQLSNRLRLLIPKNTVDRYEKKNGNYLVYGKDVAINHFGRIPLAEGTRYLYNRGNGLLLNYIILAEKRFNENNFFSQEIIINNMKAKLALGDSVLIANGKYHFSYLKRDKVIKSVKNSIVESLDDIIDYYKKALEFKLFPKAKDFKMKRFELDDYFEFLELYISFIRSYEEYRIKNEKFSIIDYIKKKSNKYDEAFYLLEKVKTSPSDELIKEIKEFLFTWHPEGIVKQIC